MIPPHWMPGRRPLLIVLGAVALLIVAYALAGFALAPWYVKRELPRWGEEYLGARARVADLAFNPFSLELHVTGVALEDRDGKPLLALREGTADIEWRSLTRRALVLASLRLSEPVARVEMAENGEINFAALGGSRPGRGRDRGLPAVVLENLVIENGALDFEDRARGYRNRFEQLSLKLSSLSTSPEDKGPYDLVARMADGGKLSWKGEASLVPLGLSGRLVIEHEALQHLNPYWARLFEGRIASGRARLELSHRFTLAGGKAALGIRDASLVVDELALVAGDSDKPLARVAHLALEGASADLQQRSAAARSLRIKGFSATAWRDAGGRLHLPLVAAQASGDKPTAWRIAISEVAWDGGTLAYAEESAGLALTMERVTGRLAAVSSDSSQPLAFEVSAAVVGGGQVSARGKAVPASGSIETRIQASGIPVAPLQPLLQRHAAVRLMSGNLALDGELTAGTNARTRRGRQAALVFRGSAALENVDLQDANGAPLVAWKSLSTPALNLSLGPAAVGIDVLHWTQPRARLEIAADGTTNLTRLFQGGGAARPAGKSAAPAALPTPAEESAGTDPEQPDEAGAVAVRVRRVQVKQGTLDFSDRSLSPNFSALIRDLTGTMNGLSTDRTTRSQLELEGRVDEFGYARLSGALNVFAPRARTQFRVQLRNLDVPKVSPYTIKFAGYRVNSGRMSLDLNYRVVDNRLAGDNKIVLDDFTLGERVADTGLPLELAVSLLKDADGRIDIAVPISGSLDDPDFKLGDVIWKAIGNIVRNILAAPFRALARLFGGDGERVAAIAFDAGSSRLLPPEQEKIQRIVAVLGQRSDLKLLIPGRYDAEADARALKRDALRREIARRAGFDAGVDDPSGPISIEDRRTRAALRQLFADREGDAALEQLKADAERQAAAGGSKPEDISVLDRVRRFASGEPRVANASDFYRAILRRLLETQPLPDGLLERTAQERAAAIAAALQGAGIDAARFTLTRAEPTADAGARQVTVQLSLAAAR